MPDDTGRPVNRRRRAVAVLGAGVAALGIAALGMWWAAVPQREQGAATVEIDAGDADLVALGAVVYADHCAACHGTALEGEADWRQRKADGTLPAPPHDVSGHTWHHADTVLFTITKSGGQAVAPPGFISGMPGFAESLTDREIAASLAFIKSHWPEEIRRRQEQISRRAE